MRPGTVRLLRGTGTRNGLPLHDYGYRGAARDAAAAPARRSPGLRPASMPSRVLAALAGLGGEATTTEVRRALEEGGTVLSASRQVPDALHRLAAMTPPQVTAAGDRRGGWGKAQRWRLGNGAAS